MESDRDGPRGYLRAIDGLRAIAVLSVMLFHMDALRFWRGGFAGVDVFFVISGYVICKSLSDRPERGFGEYLLGFYRRRFVRIAPALLAMLLAVTLASVLFIPSAWLSNAIDETGLWAFLGCSNIRLALDGGGYFSPALGLNPFLHAWSLGLEEQFYLLFPLLFFFQSRSSLARGGAEASGLSLLRRAAGAAARHSLFILACASFAISIIQSRGGGEFAYYLLPGRFWELALGALLCLAQRRGRLLARSAASSGLLVAGGLAAIGLSFIAADRGAFPFPWALPATLGTAMAICGIAGSGASSSLPARLLASKAASYVGRISYSLYLWHWPVAVLFRWTFGFESALSKTLYILASFALAAASYHFIEMPIRRSAFVKRQGSPRIILVSLAIIALSFLGARSMWRAQPEISLSATRDAYLWHSGRYCRDGPASPITDDPRVLGRKIFAIGDSHAAAYKTMLDIVSKELGVEVYELEEGDCAVAGLLKPMSDRARSHYERSLGEAMRLARPGDLVFLPALRMPEFADHFEAVDVDAIAEDFLGEEAARERALALEEARGIVDAFAATGAIVLIEAPLPVLLSPPYRCSDWFNRMNPVGANGLTVSSAFLEKMRAPVMESIRALKEERPELRVWDPFPVLCDHEVFSAFDDEGKPIFWDGDHLSGQGNRMLAPSFREFLVSLWTGELASPSGEGLD